MNVERIYNILLNEYNTDRLKIEEELERAINENSEISSKITKIKTLINKLASLEMEVNKVKEMFTIENK